MLEGLCEEIYEQIQLSAVHYVHFVKYDVTVSFLAQVLDTVTYFVSHVLLYYIVDTVTYFVADTVTYFGGNHGSRV